MTEQAGSVLGGRYRLGGPIGRGGMGAVWRATDLVLGREIAIKILVRRLDDCADTTARFRREARLLARLPHPRLGGVHDYLEENGRAFMVMELLHGETLQGRLTRTGRLPPAEAAEIAAQVAEGLHAAHQAGVIHRDVKPANIILTEQGVKLVDFGIALGAGDDRLTATGILVGSIACLAPERGAGGPATPASDVYSLGVVLYQMLAGRLPFAGTDPVQVVSAHANDPVPPLPGDVPSRLAERCVQAMAKDPALRPTSALEFAAMLRDTIRRAHHTLVMATAPSAPVSRRPAADTGRTPVPRRRRWWPPAAAGFCVLVAGTVIAAVMIADAARPADGARRGGAAANGSRSHPVGAPSVPPASDVPTTTWVVQEGAAPPAAQVPAPPPLLAPAGTTVRLAETLRNGTGRPVHDATLGVSRPPGWGATPEEPPTVRLIPAGGKASVTWRITVPAAAGPGQVRLTAAARCAAAACSAAAVTGSAIVPYASFGQTLNNTGVARQADSAQANLDGLGQSYQEEALAAAGYLPGAQVTHDGISFAWPDTHAGAPDNVAAQGQTFLITGTGPHLAFLGTADFGSAGGDGTIYYLDGTRQAFHLGMDDWWSNQATAGEDEIAVTTPRPNGPPGQAPLSGPTVAVYFASIPLAPGQTVAAVTLPPGAAPAVGVACLHLFAVAIG